MGLILIISAAAFGQVTDGLTVSVSRTVAVAADEADFAALVSASLDTTQSQVTQAFQDLGVSNMVVTAVVVGANLYAYPPVTDSQLSFLVTFTTPPGAMVGISKKLDAFRANLPPGFTALQYSASLSASTAAVTAAHDDTLPKLMSDAQARAETLARASGLKVGAICGVSEFTYAAYVYSGVGSAISSSVLSGSNSSSGGTQYSFSATVRFAAQ